MPHGILTDRMLAALAPYISGRVVHDLGAGDCTLASALLNSGALAVEAVDKQYRSQPSPMPPGGRYHCATFEEYHPADLDVVFLAWPENSRGVTESLLPLLRRARVVAYLGKNTGGTMCGTPALFEHFAGRELLAYEPDKLNTLCVYGAALPSRRSDLRREEAAGLIMGAPGDPHVDYSDD